MQKEKNMEEIDLLDVRNDFVFKSIFSDPEILIDFLNSTLSSTDKIVEVEILDSFIKKEFLEDKFSILDIKATTDKGEIIDIEIQNKDEKNMTKRSLYYWSKIFAEQIVEGANYKTLKKAICINILNFNYLDEEDFHNVYTLLNKKSKKDLNAPIELHFIELRKYLKAKELKEDNLTKWLEFITNPRKVKTKNKVVGRAVEKLEILSKDKEARILYLKRKEVIEEGRLQLDSAWEGGLEEGIEIGKEQGIEQGELKKAVETAKEMLNDDITIDVISKYTKLSKEEIISLKEKL